MATVPGLDHRKSAISPKSVASNDSALKRWRSFVKPFATQDSCDRCGRGSCDNGFEGQWENGVPSVRPRTASKTGQEGWPRVLSDAPSKREQVHHTRFASSQAISSAEGFRITYGSERDDGTTLARPSASRGSETRSSGSGSREGNGERTDADDDDEMGLAQQRRSNRYSHHKSPLSPMSPTFSLVSRERDANERPPKSILKRESIRLSALPPMPRSGGSRRSFPAGQGMAPLISSGGQKSPGVNESFVFPGPSESDMSVRSPNTLHLVAWNGLLDPDNPQNRPVPVKLLSTLLLLGLTLTVTFASSALTPASIRISEAFETTSEIIILASALTLLGFAFGAPFFAALSEMHGRKRPLLLGLAIFALFNIPVGLTTNLPTLLAFRFFAGVFGSAPLIIVPAALTDLWSPVGRGIALSFFAAISIIGPVIGAISGSYLAVVEHPGWRWTAWIAIFLSVCCSLPYALVFTESSAALLLQRKASKLRRFTRHWALHAPVEESDAGLKAHMTKTALLLVEPTLLLPAIHMSLACGVLNLLFVSYGIAFRIERHWLRGAQDLPLLPVIAGSLIGIFINFVISNKKYTAVFRSQGHCPPENRTIPWIIGAWILPIGLLVFAWTSDKEITFIPQVMAGVPTGIGISLILIGGLNYTIDTYVAMPSLAVGATTFVRSAIAFAFPLFAPRMYQTLGVDWANTTLAIIAVALIPIPILLMKLGPRLRGTVRFAMKPRPVRSDFGSRFDLEMDEREAPFSESVESGLSKPQ